MTTQIKQPVDGIENQEEFPLNAVLQIRSNKGQKNHLHLDHELRNDISRIWALAFRCD